jgi:hypothetical protein
MQNNPGVSEQITDTNRRRTHPDQDIVSPPVHTPTHGIRPRGSVWQDNPTSPRARVASHQPAPSKNTARPRQANSNLPRSQKRSAYKRQTVHTTLHLRPRVRAELERVAGLRNLSVSAAGARLLEWALEQELETQHGALLEAVIDKAIGKHMRAYSSRLAILLVRSLFTSEQTRSFVYNILVKQKDMTEEKLTAIKNGASNTARANITRVTPQMRTLIEAVQKWLEEAEKEANMSG